MKLLNRYKTRFLDMSIQNKYIVVSVISLIISFLFLSIASYHTLQNDNKKRLLEDNINSVEITSTAIDNIFDYGLSLARIIAPNSWIQTYFSRSVPQDSQEQKALVKSFLNTIVQSRQPIDSLVLYGLNGRVISSSNAALSSHTLYSQEFKNDVDYMKQNWGDPLFTHSIRFSVSGNAEKYISILKPVISISSPDIIAILEINYKETAFSSLMAAPNSKTQNRLVLLDEEGTIISGKADVIPKNLLQSLKESIGTAEKIKSKRGDFFIYLTQLKNVNWYIISSVALSEINRQANQQLLIITAIIILSLFISITGTLIISRSLAKPLRQLSQCMEEVGTGNLTATAKVTGNDEIGKMAIQFNNMLARISTLIDQVTKEKIGRRESQLLALQAQINPHFLYNTLASISSLITLELYEDSQNMLHSLEMFYKTSLSGGKNVITLEAELQNVTSYLEILKYRYDLFTYEILCPDKYKSYAITKLTLQPLVKNSIHHGIRQQLIPGELKIIVEEIHNELYISVIDNGPGIPNDIIQNFSKKIHNSYGLYNVDERIKLYFGQSYGLIITPNMQSGACVTVHLPLVTSSCEPKFIFQIRGDENDKNTDN